MLEAEITGKGDSCARAYRGIICHMRRHNITLSEPLSNRIKAQVKRGRYKDFSAAIQEAAWRYFGEPAIFEEYGVTSAEVARSHARTLEQISREKKSGQLRAWKKRS